MSDPLVIPIEGTDDVVVIHRQYHDANEMIAGDEWEPGEPLYASCSSGYSRPFFQVIPDDAGTSWHGYYWCHDCNVLWWSHDLDATSVCWSCGAEAAHPDDLDEQKLRSEITQQVYRVWA